VTDGRTAGFLHPTTGHRLLINLSSKFWPNFSGHSGTEGRMGGVQVKVLTTTYAR
jgi:hypothetical protein